MPFEKGHAKHPGSGMKQGQKTAKVQAWEVLGEYLCDEMAGQYLEWVKTLKGEEMAKQFQTMIEYFRPKLQRSEIKAEMGELQSKVQTVYEALQQENDIPETTQ